LYATGDDVRLVEVLAELQDDESSRTDLSHLAAHASVAISCRLQHRSPTHPAGQVRL